MNVRTNVAKPPKKKKPDSYTAPAPPKAVVEKGSTPEYKLQRGASTYKPVDVRTGKAEYGKESATKPTPEFIKKAQSGRVDTIVGKGGSQGKEGLSYAAGVRTTTPDKVTSSFTPPRLRFEKSAPAKQASVRVSTNKSKPGKLKAMDMTYGTDSPKKGGGTKYVKRVKR